MSSICLPDLTEIFSKVQVETYNGLLSHPIPLLRPNTDIAIIKHDIYWGKFSKYDIKLMVIQIVRNVATLKVATRDQVHKSKAKYI